MFIIMTYLGFISDGSIPSGCDLDSPKTGQASSHPVEGVEARRGMVEVGAPGV